jgi:hypothetical protein
MPWSDADLTKLPPDLRRDLRGFIEHGRLPPPWLAAVLANDLRGFIEHQRTDGTKLVRALWTVLEHAPLECQGSMRAVLAWTQRGGMLSRHDPTMTERLQ